ncbi:reverse transcriptase [Gossypium australe]|uniref:Reverse transcriptase n=1 Tax=Gossypium australe TaxID=47621 RepID=A0A5B6VM89_9ROSI|nr:reverse transcriptase [Gossypium australe]
MNECLNASYEKEKILIALRSTALTKSSGPDGLPALFYQYFWHIVGNDVSYYCLEVLNKGKSLAEINKTNIFLIPRTSSPTLVNKFQKVLNSAFVPGRLIMDNILLAYEIFNVYKWKRFGNKGNFALKLDMSKTYDRVGFITHYVSTVSYSIVLNGVLGKEFFPRRGLRQRDPLNPYLFFIRSEGLSSLIWMAIREGVVRGAKLSRRVNEALILKQILVEYMNASEQCVNFDKLIVYLSLNVGENVKEDVVGCLGVGSSTNLERYLGLPNMVDQNKRWAFQVLEDRMKSRIENS